MSGGSQSEPIDGPPSGWRQRSVIEVVAVLVEGSLEVKLPTIWTDEKDSQMKRTARKKHSQEETRTWRKSEGRREEMEKVRREKMQVREKVAKSRNTVFFQCFVAPKGRKVGSLKRRVRRHLGR